MPTQSPVPGQFAAVISLSTLNGTNGNGFELDGVSAGDQSGLSVSVAGDINHDGITDIIIGAPNANSGAGKTYVVFGKASGWTSPISLSTLNGANGFELDGVSAGDQSGFSVSVAGDVNHDGIADIIIGAPSYPTTSVAGKTYVVFGKASGWTSPISLSTLNGANGFELDGEVGDNSGRSVSAGDVNHDGITDIIIGAPNANSGAGKTYVVFGKSSAWGSPSPLRALNGASGFELDGVSVGDSSGASVSAAGDVNNDGIADIIIGAPYANSTAGKTYVVFGKANSWTSPISLNTIGGANGFELDGVSAGDQSGKSVSAAGDVNNDGIADIIIGAPYANSAVGKTYVVFGKASAWTSPISLNTLGGANGFELDGVSAGDQSGWSVSVAGDVNNDGIADIIIGTPGSATGKTYIVFGKASGWGSPIPLSTLNGANGFGLDGELAGDRSGTSVNTAGDVNHDGITDIIIGAPNANSNAGKTYVVFGRGTLPVTSSATRISPAWFLPISQVASLLDSSLPTVYSLSSDYLIGSDASQPFTHNALYTAPSLETVSAQLMLGAVALKLAQKGVNWAKGFWVSKPALKPDALSEAAQSMQTKDSEPVLRSATKDLTADIKHLSEKMETYQACLEETSVQSTNVVYPDFQKPGINFAYNAGVRKRTSFIAAEQAVFINSARAATFGP